MFDMNGRIKIGEIDMYSQLLGQEESLVKSYKCMDVGSPLYMAPEQVFCTFFENIHKITYKAPSNVRLQSGCIQSRPYPDGTLSTNFKYRQS